MSVIKDLKAMLKVANAQFKNAKYDKAIEIYGNIIKYEGINKKEEGQPQVLGSGRVFDDKFEILFDAHLNRSACHSTIEEWELATLDALKCKEMNDKSIKVYARLATAYQGAGDHLACIKECKEGLKIRDSDIALRQIWMNSERMLHPNKYKKTEIMSPLSHDHSHEHGHSHAHSHSHGHDHGHNNQPQLPYLSKSSSYESDIIRSDISGFGAAASTGSAGRRGRGNPTSLGDHRRSTPSGARNEKTCVAICCFT